MDGLFGVRVQQFNFVQKGLLVFVAYNPKCPCACSPLNFQHGGTAATLLKNLIKNLTLHLLPREISYSEASSKSTGTFIDFGPKFPGVRKFY